MEISTKFASYALKEWAVAVKALAAGEMILLLRKGGLKETRRGFQVKYPKFWLYPTYEHQKPELLKPQYAAEVTPVASGWHPETVEITCGAEVADSFSVADAEKIEALAPYHIWNQDFVRERLHWQPHQPITVILLRTYQLPEPVILPYRQEYGGCQSWLDSLPPIEERHLIPSLGEREYQQKSAKITNILR